MGDTRTLVHETAELYPLDGALAMVANAVEELEEGADLEGFLDHQLRGLFSAEGELSPAEELMATQLVRWIKNNEQAASNEKALAEPHLREAEGHLARAKAIQRTSEWLRSRLVGILDRAGGRATLGEHRAFLRTASRIAVVGYCKSPVEGHQVRHFDDDHCVSFRPDEQGIPPEYLRVTVEARKQEIAGHLRALPVPVEDWAAQVPGKVSVVIR